VAGELVDIGFRPKLVASFDPPGAEARFREWREANEALLGGIPLEAWQVDYGRAAAGGLSIRVRIDESHLPHGLTAA
jgi:hypothetical protein